MIFKFSISNVSKNSNYINKLLFKIDSKKDWFYEKWLYPDEYPPQKKRLKIDHFCVNPEFISGFTQIDDGDYEALIQISPVGLLKGNLPPRALGLVLEWAQIYQKELIKDWKLATNHKKLYKIPPLQ